MIVSISPAANDDLWEIWVANVNQYRDTAHADSYVDFLRSGIDELASDFNYGRRTALFPEFRFITLRKRNRGHGHYVIYKVDESRQSIMVLRVYHTRMDVESRLRQEFE